MTNETEGKMSDRREEYLSHLTRAERLHEDGFMTDRLDGEDMRRYTDEWCQDCDHHLDECECDEP